MSKEEIRTTRKLVYESTNTKKSIIQIYKNNPVRLPKSMVSIPKWVLVFFGLLIALLTIVLLAAILIVLTAPRAAQYMENCTSRSCQSGLNMKCINQVCKCESNRYYMKGCVEKKSYDESCAVEYECLSDKGLTCFNGKCKCNKTQYWHTDKCANRYTYGEFCSDDQCLSTIMLECINSICQCNSTRFWNSFGCIRKRTVGERCYNDGDCIENQILKCHNGTCGCLPTWEYFDSQLRFCQPKINESQTCSLTEQCLGEMQCLNQNCTCGSFFYFMSYNYTCLPQASFNQSCTTNITCRGDLGLFCSIDGTCVCDPVTQYWNSTMCATYLTYGQTGCTSDSDCRPNLSLTCNSYLMSYSCNCPNESLTSMCDCPRIMNNESYWNSTHCVSAGIIGSQCTYDYECQTITLGLACISNQCTQKCQIGWSYHSGKCYKMFSNSGSCTPDSTGKGCDENDINQNCVTQATPSQSKLAILSSSDIFYFTRTMDPNADKSGFIDSYIGGYWEGLYDTTSTTTCDCDWSWTCSDSGCIYQWVWMNGIQINTVGSVGGWCGSNVKTNRGNNPTGSNNFDFCVRTKDDCFTENNCEDNSNFICEYQA